MAELKAIKKISTGKRMKGNKRKGERLLLVMKHTHTNNKGLAFIHLSQSGREAINTM